MKPIDKHDLTGMCRREVAEYARWRFFIYEESERHLAFYDRVTCCDDLDAVQVKNVMRDMGAHSWFIAQTLKSPELFRRVHTQPLWIKGAPPIFVEVETGHIFRNLWKVELGMDADAPDGILDISPGGGWTIDGLVRDVDLWEEQRKAMSTRWGFGAEAKLATTRHSTGNVEDMK